MPAIRRAENLSYRTDISARISQEKPLPTVAKNIFPSHHYSRLTPHFHHISFHISAQYQHYHHLPHLPHFLV
jgi:hypothetical protein